MNEQNQMDEITPDMQEQIKEIKEILDSPEIEPTMALNIIINAVQVCYDSEEVFNDLDKALISKALTCFQDRVKKGENFVIKVAE
jgi:hypothetical protein